MYWTGTRESQDPWVVGNSDPVLDVARDITGLSRLERLVIEEPV